MWIRSATSYTFGILWLIRMGGRAPGAPFWDGIQNLVALIAPQRGRRLVEDHDLAAERRGPRHRHALALPTGQALHGLPDVLQRGDAQLAHVALGLAAHALVVEHPQHAAGEARLAQL